MILKQATLIALSMLATCTQAEDFSWKREMPSRHGMSAEKLDQLKNGLEQRGTKALLVVRNDAIVYEWYSDDHGPDKQHFSASMAKALVGGVSLAVAMSDGRIALDDPAAKYVRQWAGDPAKSKITIRQLGSHASGLDDAEADGLSHNKLTGWKGDFWKRRDPPNDPFSISRDKTPLLFDPGTKFQYSNPGIAMLSYAITAALKDAPERDLRTLLRDRVMRPIGVPDREWSVGYGRTFQVDGLPLVGAWGGGGYTARATARIGRLMLRKGNWEGTQLIRADAVRETTRDGDAADGMNGNAIGWFTNAGGIFKSLPRDAIFAEGAQEQILLLVPSLNLIVVRNGSGLGEANTKEEYIRLRETILYKPLMEAVKQTPADEQSASDEKAHNDPLETGIFHWRVGPPLLKIDSDRLPPSPEHEWLAIKDPSVVRYDDRWHLFCTLRKNKKGDGRIRIGYLTFDDWATARRADWHVLELTPGYHGAPQIFYFAPQRKWYLIYQAEDQTRGLKYGPCFSTNEDIADPAKWTLPEPLYVVKEGVKAGLDFWVICDDEKAHLFFTTLNGRMWRAETLLKDFPNKGWSDPKVVLQADIFEASHTYRLKGRNQYFTIVEAQTNRHRYFKGYVASRLDGDWTPLAGSREKPLVSPRNVVNQDESWATSYSHGEFIRTGFNQMLEIDPEKLQLLFQGANDKEYQRRNYGQIPWRLGMLKPE